MKLLVLSTTWLFWICLLAACGGNQRLPVEVPMTLVASPSETPTIFAPNTAEPPVETVAVADAAFTKQTMALESATIAAADMDGDGHQDLVVGGEPEITVFRGDGTGKLTRHSRAPGGQEPSDFAFADLDGDGYLDIVIANHNTDYLTALLGDGAGLFHPAPFSPLRVDVRPHPHVVRAADLDGDGLVDLIVDNRDAEGVLILRGMSGGQVELPGVLVPVGGDPYLGMALGDLDSDGDLDLVTPNVVEVGVMRHDGGNGIAYVPAAPVAATAPFAVALGDFNGDGHLDLLTAADEGSPLVELFLGNGQAAFAQAPDSPFQLATGGKNIVVGDFNGDGTDDAAICSYHWSDVMVLLGGSPARKVGSLAGGERPWGLAATDLNGDGRDDLIVADDGSFTATVYLTVAP